MPVNYETLLVETNQNIARITLNRPERRNALSLALMRELTAALRSLGESREASAVILAASGKVFSSLRFRTSNTHRSFTLRSAVLT